MRRITEGKHDPMTAANYAMYSPQGVLSVAVIRDAFAAADSEGFVGTDDSEGWPNGRDIM